MYAAYMPNMCSMVAYTCIYAVCMQYVCSMYAVCMLYECSMYAAHMPNMCSKEADIYTIKNGVYNIHSWVYHINYSAAYTHATY